MIDWRINANGIPAQDGWVRNSEWLAMPAVNIGDQKFVGLHAVYDNDANFAALSATAAYTVDWGDGTVENVASGVSAYHLYDFADVALDGTLTTDGYKQAIVTVTPQVANNLATLNLNVQHNQTGLQNYNTGWLDIALASSFLTDLLIGSNIHASASALVFNYSIQRINIVEVGTITDCGYLFYDLRGLQSLSLFDTSNVTSAGFMFSGCTRLSNYPAFDFSSLITGTSLFSSSVAKKYPVFTFGALQTANNMFVTNAFLEELPLIDFSTVTSATSLTQTVPNSLWHIPALDWSAITSITFGTQPESLSKIDAFGLRYTLSLASCKLSKDALETFFSNLGIAATGATRTITISGNWGADTAVSLTGTTTAGSDVVTMASTTGVVVGQHFLGTGSPTTTAIAVTFTDIGDLVGLTAHGLSNGDIVSFPTVGTSGLTAYQPVYVINANANDFQVSATLGGSALPIAADSTGTMLYSAYVESIDPNVSVTLTRPATSTSTSAKTFRVLDVSQALLKGFAISG